MKNDRLERGALNLEEIRAKLERERDEVFNLKRVIKTTKKNHINLYNKEILYIKELLLQSLARHKRLEGYWEWRERVYFDRYNKTTL